MNCRTVQLRESRDLGLASRTITDRYGDGISSLGKPDDERVLGRRDAVAIGDVKRVRLIW